MVEKWNEEEEKEEPGKQKKQCRRGNWREREIDEKVKERGRKWKDEEKAELSGKEKASSFPL